MSAVLQLLGPSSGGIRRHVDVLARNLPTHGWDCVVAGPPGVMDGLPTTAEPVGVTTNPVGATRAARSVRSLARGVDIVHAHGLTAGWTAVAARTGLPVVVTVHNVVLAEAAGRATPVLRRLESRLPRAVDRVIAVSPQIAHHLGGPDDSISVIIPASDPPAPVASSADLRGRLGLADDTRLIVTVARLHPQKAIGDLLVAMAEVRDRVGLVHLAVVGDGPERTELEARSTGLGLDGVVTFVGEHHDAAGWMAAADLVAVSSIWEGSPLVVAEALQLGRPLVATDVGDVAEVVHDGRTGRLVPPSSPHHLADAIVDLLSDPERAAVLGAAARPVAAKRYGVDTLVGAVADVYLQETADGSARSTPSDPEPTPEN